MKCPSMQWPSIEVLFYQFCCWEQKLKFVLDTWAVPSWIFCDVMEWAWEKNWIHSFNLFYIPCLNSNVFTLHVTQYSRWWHPGRTLFYFLYTAIENNKKEWHDTTWLWRQQKNGSSPLQLANTFDIKCFDRTETSAQLIWHKRI